MHLKYDDTDDDKCCRHANGASRNVEFGPYPRTCEWKP